MILAALSERNYNPTQPKGSNTGVISSNSKLDLDKKLKVQWPTGHDLVVGYGDIQAEEQVATSSRSQLEPRKERGHST
jgi:hypothetical protein